MVKNNCRDKKQTLKMSIYSVEQAFQSRSGDSVPFPNAEGSNSVDLYCSQMRKITKQQDCTVPKYGRHKLSRFVLFPNAESINSVELYHSQMRKTTKQQDCIVPKCGWLKFNCFVLFAVCESLTSTKL